jgi:hypothetical protein
MSMRISLDTVSDSADGARSGTVMQRFIGATRGCVCVCVCVCVGVTSSALSWLGPQHKWSCLPLIESNY